MNTEGIRTILSEGQVIPACPLALNEDGSWSERHQRALIRYYFASRAGGIAVGVHSTQFAIRDPSHDLLAPILRLVAEEIDHLSRSSAHGMAMIAGICGDTVQALSEVDLAREHGYHAGLLSMAALGERPEEEVLQHCRSVAASIPLVGFYLQPAVGGRVFQYRFWREFVEIENVVAIKIAPFNRYQTWDVVRAVIDSGRNDISLYTGNDDNIVPDLLTPFTCRTSRGNEHTIRIVGGLLGQWGVWTSNAVRLLDKIKEVVEEPRFDSTWLEYGVMLTDANAAIFDAANQFAGCIPGIMEILRRQGLVPSNRCLDPNEVLSSGQAAELDRVALAYPNLQDDLFVRENLDSWLA